MHKYLNVGRVTNKHIIYILHTQLIFIYIFSQKKSSFSFLVPFSHSFLLGIISKKSDDAGVRRRGYIYICNMHDHCKGRSKRYQHQRETETSLLAFAKRKKEKVVAAVCCRRIYEAAPLYGNLGSSPSFESIQQGTQGTPEKEERVKWMRRCLCVCVCLCELFYTNSFHSDFFSFLSSFYSFSFSVLLFKSRSTTSLLSFLF